MQLLTTSRVYDAARDRGDADFLRLVTNPPEGLEILDGNAGLGADWPAGIWKSLNGAAIGLAIISAPSTIEENWPRWKVIFDSITQKVLEFHGEYRIDRDTAQVLAIHHSVHERGLAAERVNVHMAIRHYFAAAAGYEDLLATKRTDMFWPTCADIGTEAFLQGVRSNEEAARQARCRYLFGIEDGSECLTVAIEQDGRVSMASNLDMSGEWG